MDVVVRHLEPTRVAFVRHVGPYTACGPAWVALSDALRRQGVLVENPLMVGVCYDNPAFVAPAKLRYDACATVGADYAPCPGLAVQVLAGGDFATARHRGPYAAVGAIYAELFRWAAQSARPVRPAPSLEIYLNDVHTTAPEDLLTEVWLPIQAEQAEPGPGPS